MIPWCRPAPALTWDELLTLTTVAPCASCDMEHAPVRACDQSEREKRYHESNQWGR